MDRFNTPWRVTSAAIYTTPTDSRVYGTLDIDVTEAKKYLDRKRAPLTMDNDLPMAALGG